jgi:hypothetical protein
MGFDPRRWRPSSGSRPLTTNVEALLAENEALRREVRSLRLQLEVFLQGEAASRPWEPMGAPPRAQAAAAAAAAGPWSSSARSRASRASWSSTEPPRSRVTVGSSHGLSPDLVERWSRTLARHPRWTELRIGPPGGLRGLEEELRRHWWNPGLSLEQELDRRCPGLGSELTEALRGPHSRGRWAVRVAFALYGPRAPEWLSEEPLRVVEELLRREQQLEPRGPAGPGRRAGTRTANTSSACGSERAGQSADRRAADEADPDPGQQQRRQAGSNAGSGGHHQGHQRSASRSRGSHKAAPPDPRAQALALLGLEHDASAAAIKRAYRRLAKAHHPDLGGDAEAFRHLDAAYRSLL